MTDERRRQWRARAAIFAALAVVAAVYLPDAGGAYFKDDFAWIHQSRVRGGADLLDLFRRAQGFYRPLVGISFACDYALFGLEPRGYGLTNLLLFGLAAFALFRLGRRLGLGAGAAALASCLWMLNPHGVHMALLWISGRTSLLLSLFALLAALALLAGRRWLAAFLFLLALFSKEDAVLLPVALAAIVAARADGRLAARLGRGLAAVWHLAMPLALYLALRFSTPAFLPHSAPGYYRFTLAPLRLLDNLAEYLARTSTLAVVALALLALAAWRLPRPEAERQPLAAGLAFAACGLGLVLFLPVRSDLYALYPALGTSLAAAAGAAAIWRRTGERRRRRIAVVAVLLPLMLYPTLRARGWRWREGAPESRLAVRGLVAEKERLRRAAWLALSDRTPGGRQLASIFGTLAQEAARCATGNEALRVWLEPPPAGWELSGREPPPPGAAVARLDWDGRRFTAAEQ